MFCFPCHLAGWHQGLDLVPAYSAESGWEPGGTAEGFSGSWQRVPALSYLQTSPRTQAGRWSPGFTRPSSALSSECAEGVTPADSNKQVGSRGERKTRQDGKAIFLPKNIPGLNVMLASESWESEFQKANKEACTWFCFVFSFPFYFQGRASFNYWSATFSGRPWPQFPSL